MIWINGYDILEKKRKALEIKNLTLHSNTFDRNVTISIPVLENVNLSNNDFKKLFQNYSILRKGYSILRPPFNIR